MKIMGVLELSKVFYCLNIKNFEENTESSKFQGFVVPVIFILGELCKWDTSSKT